MWDAQVCIYDNYACALAETLELVRFRAIFEVIIFFIRVHAGAYWHNICAIIECFEANLKT